MEKITVELDYDTVDRIVKQEMRYSIRAFENSLRIRQQSPEHGRDPGAAVFVHERDMDILLLEDHIRACKLVLRYYGEDV